MDIKFLGRKDLEAVLEMPKVIEGVKSAYTLKAQGKTVVWPLVAHDFEEEQAVMDIRSGGVFGDENIHGLKMLNNFPLNKEQGLPPFNGMLMMFDSKTGIPLGVMDAAYITCMRTGAAGAIGAQALARKGAETLFVLGAGKQAIFQIAGEIGQVLAGEIPGRQSEEEITIFDATGLALLDLVTGKRAIELAEEKKIGLTAEI